MLHGHRACSHLSLRWLSRGVWPGCLNPESGTAVSRGLFNAGKSLVEKSVCHDYCPVPSIFCRPFAFQQEAHSLFSVFSFSLDLFCCRGRGDSVACHS